MEMETKVGEILESKQTIIYCEEFVLNKVSIISTVHLIRIEGMEPSITGKVSRTWYKTKTCIKKELKHHGRYTSESKNYNIEYNHDLKCETEQDAIKTCMRTFEILINELQLKIA